MDVLGSGGMGTVYLGVHRHSGRSAALKVLHPDLSENAEVVERFLNEARAVNLIRHPDIVDIYDFGWDFGRDSGPDPEGSPTAYLVMEYLQGESLRHRLRRGALPLGEALRVARRVASALQAAHNHDIVHRDLKPDNVFLVNVGDDARPPGVKVVDFGVAKLRGDAVVTSTGKGALLGTPTYMAPEQCQGARASDARADIYALGVMLFELLAGRPPFPGQGIAQLFNAHLFEPPPRLSDVLGGVPPALDECVNQTLAKDPDARPGSMSAVADRLAEVMARIAPGPAASSASMEAAPAAAVWETEIEPTPQRRVSQRLDTPQRSEQATLLGSPGARKPFSSQRRSNIGARSGPAFGREGSLARLADRTSHGARLVTVLGPGGTGKTWLALRHGARMTEQETFRRGGVWFCDLTHARSAEDVRAVVASTLGIPLMGRDAEAAAFQLVLALAGRGATLLILDNFEQVVAHAAATVGDWLARAPKTSFLVTSREALGIPGEVRHRLGPLDPDDAVDLFMQHATTVRHGFTLNDEERQVVQELVQLLDRNALAIELAAARMDRLSPAELRDRLPHRLELLESQRARTGGRPATLRAVIDSSWQLLAPRERSVLARCSVFRGGFTPEAAEAVVALGPDGDVPAILASLHRKSLLRGGPGPAGGASRYRCDQSTRIFAAQQLGQDEAHAAGARHALHFAGLAVQWADGIYGQEALECLQNLEIETENLLAAHRYSIEWEPLQAVHIALAMDRLYTRRGSIFESVRLLDEAVHAADRAGDLQLSARALLARGGARATAGQLDAAEEDLQAAAVAARLVRDTGLAAQADRNLIGVAVLWRGAVDDFVPPLERALAVLRDVGNRREEAVTLCALGNALLQTGEIEAPTRPYLQALEIARELGDVNLQATLHLNLGILASRQGKRAESLRWTGQAMDLARKVHNRLTECVAANNIATQQMLEGALPEAWESLRHSRAISREAGILQYAGLFYINTGLLLLLDRRADEAPAYFQQGVQVLTESSAQRFLSAVLAYMSVAEAETDRPAAARATLARSRAEAEGARSAEMLAAAGIFEGIIEVAEARQAAACDDLARSRALRNAAEARFGDGPAESVPVEELFARVLLRQALDALP